MFFSPTILHAQDVCKQVQPHILDLYVWELMGTPMYMLRKGCFQAANP